MRLLVLCCCILLIPACGFKLRGVGGQHLSAMFAKTYLNDTLAPADGFYIRIKQAIKNNGGILVDQSEAAVAVSISPVSQNARQIASSSNGLDKQYEVTYQTTVTLTDVSNGAQLGSRTLSTTEYLNQDDSRILSSEQQSNITLADAERNLARAVIDYLSTFK